jgi:hypothetical protein
MEFEDLKEALDVFSLTGKASLQEIKARHRALVKRHHPDAGGSENDPIRQINAAYQILLAYCRDYRFSFSREEFLEQRPEERLRQQFAQDPIWGG